MSNRRGGGGGGGALKLRLTIERNVGDQTPAEGVLNIRVCVCVCEMFMFKARVKVSENISGLCFFNHNLCHVWWIQFLPQKPLCIKRFYSLRKTN